MIFTYWLKGMCRLITLYRFSPVKGIVKCYHLLIVISLPLSSCDIRTKIKSNLVTWRYYRLSDLFSSDGDITFHVIRSCLNTEPHEVVHD